MRVCVGVRVCVYVCVIVCVFWGKCCIAAVSPRAINCQWQLHVEAGHTQTQLAVRDLAADTRTHRGYGRVG